MFWFGVILEVLVSFCRKLFEEFDPSAIAQFTEKRMMSLRVNGCLILSEQKLRAIVENAKSVLKVGNSVF